MLIYDIRMDQQGVKIQRSIFKICKRFLIHVQHSVFEGELTKSQFVALKSELKQFLRPDEDSCILFVARNNRWLEKEFLTSEVDQLSCFL